MKFTFALFCFSRSFVSLCRLNLLKAMAITHGLLFLPCCKQESASTKQSSESTDAEGFAVKINPELPARPAKDAITPEQQAFWDYIEIFNRLPDNPTEVQQEIFATRGEAPKFKVISISPKSVLTDVEGMKAHRERFAQRYPWVKRLLKKEQINLEVNASIYQGTAKEISDKHRQMVDESYGNYFQPEGTRSAFTKRWLESLLVVDYIFACGSEQDRIDGFSLLTQAFAALAPRGDEATGRKEYCKELEIPAIFDIGIAITNQFPENMRGYVPEILINALARVTSSTGHTASYIECLKWSLRVEALKKLESDMDFHRVMVGNRCVENQMFHYTIYWYHLHEEVRPFEGSSAVAIKNLFSRLYGKEEGPKEHKKYMALLDAAYPPPPKHPSKNKKK
jgi:hypothetical protein